MLCGDGSHSQRLGQCSFFPPVKFATGDVFFQQLCFHAKRNNKLRMMLITDLSNGGNIEMVIVIVADKHKIDSWKIFKTNSGRSHSFWAKPLKWAYAFAEYRVQQNVDAVGLHQKGGVVDKSNDNAIRYR